MTHPTVKPPYYSVIFTSIRTLGNDDEYHAMATQMVQLAHTMPGFLGVDSARDSKLGITVSYWKDETSIAHWKQQADHLQAQKYGKLKFYEHYTVTVARVERAYQFTAKNQ